MADITIGTAMYETFSSPYGKSTLAWILDRCGYFETDPAKVKPELTALANGILAEMRIGMSGDMGAYMDAIIGSHDAEI